MTDHRVTAEAELECSDADECGYHKSGRPAGHHPGVPAGGRAAAAARTDAAQHLRAALSRHDRRRAALGPSPDRHDPARSRASRHRGEARPLQGRLRRPAHPVRRIRRWPLPHPAHRHRALPHRGRTRRRDALPAVPRELSSRSSATSARARARTRSTARACSRRSRIFCKPTTSRPTGRASRTRPTRRWSMRSQ